MEKTADYINDAFEELLSVQKAARVYLGVYPTKEKTPCNLNDYRGLFGFVYNSEHSLNQH